MALQRFSATENFAVAIASGLGYLMASESAMALARFKLALLRIRSLRLDMLAALWECPILAGLQRLHGLERYERAALVQQKRALRFRDGGSTADLGA